MEAIQTQKKKKKKMTYINLMTMKLSSTVVNHAEIPTPKKKIKDLTATLEPKKSSQDHKTMLMTWKKHMVLETIWTLETGQDLHLFQAVIILLLLVSHGMSETMMRGHNLVTILLRHR